MPGNRILEVLLMLPQLELLLASNDVDPEVLDCVAADEQREDGAVDHAVRNEQRRLREDEWHRHALRALKEAATAQLAQHTKEPAGIGGAPTTATAPSNHSPMPTWTTIRPE